jgi:hypothetical protein
MSYSDFTLDQVKVKFNLSIDESQDLFSKVNKVEISNFLKELLHENIPLAHAIHTEKARSEMLIAPVLIELRKKVNHQISLFSGVDFTVDNQQGLNGICDFIISRSKEQLYITSPVIMIAEAKNENIKSGLAQCIASMIAARIFNEKNNKELSIIYGVVTTGTIWKFVKFENNIVFIDIMDYYIKEIDVVFGILLNIVNSNIEILV